MPVQTPRQLAGAEPSPYGASFAPPPEMDMSYGSGAQFTEPEGASQSRGGNPPEQGFNSRVLTSAACITAMIQKLRSTEDGVKREAMQAIRMWAGSSLLHQRAVAAAGAIPPLVDVLRSPSSTIVSCFFCTVGKMLGASVWRMLGMLWFGWRVLGLIWIYVAGA